MENKKFTKDDLKVGYVAVTANQHLFMVMSSSSNRLCLVDESGSFLLVDSLNNDLRDPCPIGDHDFSVVRVYGYSRKFSSSRNISASDRELLWKREEAKKMTVEEIEKELGYKIEIVG